MTDLLPGPPQWLPELQFAGAPVDPDRRADHAGQRGAI